MNVTGDLPEELEKIIARSATLSSEARDAVGRLVDAGVVDPSIVATGASVDELFSEYGDGLDVVADPNASDIERLSKLVVRMAEQIRALNAELTDKRVEVEDEELTDEELNRLEASLRAKIESYSCPFLKRSYDRGAFLRLPVRLRKVLAELLIARASEENFEVPSLWIKIQADNGAV